MRNYPSDAPKMVTRGKGEPATQKQIEEMKALKEKQAAHAKLQREKRAAKARAKVERECDEA